MKILISAILTLFVASAFAGHTVDTKASSFKWQGTKIKGKHFGKINLKESTIAHDSKGNVTGGTFVMDINSFTVDDMQGEWADKLSNHLKSPDFFNTKKWPTAKLVISSVKNGKAKGQLTIKDKTQDVTVPFKKSGDAYKGTLKFDRTKFGMIYKSKNFFKNLGDKVVNDEVTLEFKVVIKDSKAKKTAKAK